MQFDEYAANYQTDVEHITGVSAENLAGEKARLIIGILSKCVDDPKRLRVLDIGCGIGLIDPYLENEVAEICGADTSIQSLEFARIRAPRTRFVHYDGETLPMADNSFDAAFVCNVLHHIPLAARSKFITEMVRAIRPGGVAIVIEHNPFNPATQQIVMRCAFDADAVLLKLSETVNLLNRHSAPVVGRRYIGFSPFRHPIVEKAEQALGWLPIGAQYCVWGVKSPR